MRSLFLNAPPRHRILTHLLLKLFIRLFRLWIIASKRLRHDYFFCRIQPHYDIAFTAFAAIVVDG